jgi:hypothetical protein
LGDPRVQLASGTEHKALRIAMTVAVDMSAPDGMSPSDESR